MIRRAVSVSLLALALFGCENAVVLSEDGRKEVTYCELGSTAGCAGRACPNGYFTLEQKADITSGPQVVRCLSASDAGGSR